MLTAYGDVELAVRALKGGAADFVLKPWDNDNLIGKIRAALHERKSSQLVHPVERPSEPAMIIGHSPVMMKLIKVVTKVAKTDANVLITGENGTGKEMLAREIHRLSLRSGREMVNVDMGAVSESLFESELFGHERGAFTDARESRPGKFEAAHGSVRIASQALGCLAESRGHPPWEQSEDSGRHTPDCRHEPQPAGDGGSVAFP